MENYKFEEIPMEHTTNNQSKVTSWKPLYRQIMICIGVWSIYFMPGLFMGVPPVFIARTRKEANSTEAVSNEMASWLSSAFNYGSIPWVFILPIVGHYYGRKVVFYISSINAVASYILLYCSQSAMQVMFCELMAGIALASHTVAVMIIAEYTSPRYRGVFITLKSAILYWGVWVANAIGTFFHWRNIAVAGFVSSIFCGTVIFWPESPYWLASKKKFKTCVESHRWLKGVDSESEKELEIMINFQKEKAKGDRSSLRSGWRKFKDVIQKKEVYKPVLLSLPLIALYYSSGKMVCTMYILDIIKDLTKSESTAYLAMLLLDGVTVLGMYIGCILTIFLKRRTILLGSSSVGVTFLYITSLYLYLSELHVIEKNHIVLIALLTGYSIFISVGPMLMITAIYGEIMPRDFAHEASVIGGLSDAVFGTVMLKFAPDFFYALGFHGSFLLYSISSTVLIIILYKYLPETKDKTLQEISDWFKGNIAFNHTRNELRSLT